MNGLKVIVEYHACCNMAATAAAAAAAAVAAAAAALKLYIIIQRMMDRSRICKRYLQQGITAI